MGGTFSRRGIAALALSYVVAVSAAGCGGGGGGGGGVAPAPAGPPVSGKVVAGIVSGATVRVFRINADRSLTLVAEGTTAADGTYTLTPTGDGPFLVLAGGGTYEDEATGQTRTLAAPASPATLDSPRPGLLESIIGSGAGTGPVSVSLTPLSTMAARRTAALSTTDPTALAEGAVAAAATAIGAEMGLGAGVDPRGVVPLDFSDPAVAAQIAANPNSPAARLGAVLAGLSQAAEDLGLSNPLSLVDALASDFSDGVLNGLSGTSTIPLGGGSLSPTAGTSDLAASTQDFLDDPTANQSGTTSTQFATLTQAISTQDQAPPGVNKAPTVDLVVDQATSAGAGTQTVTLTGLGAGVSETGQTLTVTVTSSAPSIVPTPALTGSGATRTLTYVPLTAGTATITVRVQDDGGTASGGVDTTVRTFQVVVAPMVTLAPTITSAPVLIAVDGFAYSYPVVATGTPAPTITAVGTPNWMNLVGGALTGTPTSSDIGVVSSITVTATNVAGSTTQSFQVSVLAAVPPSITSTPGATARVGQLYTYTLTATGTPLPTFSVVGLPAWLTRTGNVLSGTPGAGDVGLTGTIVVTASNLVAPDATQNVVIDVQVEPTITSTAPTTVQVGQPYTYTITATGNPTPTVSVSGNPPWLTLTGNVLSGTPGPGDVGASGPITITASNGLLPSDTETFAVDVQSPPAITSAPPPATASFGVAYAFTATASGNPAPTFSLSGGPAWLTISPAGLLSGTPGALDVGFTGTVTITASNGIAPDATQAWLLTVTGPPTITSTAPAVAVVGQPYSYTITTAAFPAATLSVSGSPAWLTLTGDVLSGTPGPGDLGASPSITITASNGTAPDDTETFTIDVRSSPSITSAPPPPTASFGVAYVHTATATGNPAPTFSLSGNPAWLTISPAGSLTGAPGALDVGFTGTVTITASNGIAPVSTQDWLLTVTGPPTITSTPPAVATVGQPYSYPITTAAFPPATLSVSGNPPWLTLNLGTGALEGTPGPGDLLLNGPITITASNGTPPDATQTFSIDVQGAPTITSAPPPTSATVGVAYSHAVTTTGNPAPTLSLTPNAPAWLTLVGSSLVGTPGPNDSAGFIGTITLTASNGIAPVSTQDFFLQVEGPPHIDSGTPNPAAQVGQPYFFPLQYNGYNPALPGPPTVTLTGAPGWLSVDGTGTALVGTPGPGDTGVTTGIVLTVDNGLPPAATQTFSITVQGAPIITSAPPPPAVVGAPFSYTATAIGNPTPTFSLSNAPAWLSISAGGSLTGTPGAGDVGVHGTVTILASNGIAPVASQDWVLVVTQPPAITSTAPGVATVGAPYSYPILTTGFPQPALTLTTAPGWLSLNPATRTLEGTPGPGDEVPFGFIVVTASNGVGSDAVQMFTIDVRRSPAFTSPSPSTLAAVGVAYVHTVTTVGNPAPTLSLTPNAPAWLTISGGQLVGTPGPTDSVAFIGPITLTASNGVAPVATQDFFLQVAGPPHIDSPPPNPTAQVGQPYFFPLQYNGYNPGLPGPPTVTLTGNPGWLSVGAGGTALVGTPGPGDVGLTTGILLTVDNGLAPAATQTFSIDVQGPPTITSGPPPAIAVVGVAYTHSVTVTGNPAPSLSLSGNPPWLSFSGQDLVGTPAQGDLFFVGSVTITASNGGGAPATQTWSLTVQGPPTFTSTPVTAATVGQPYSYPVTALASPSATISPMVALPGWLSLVGGTLQGIPAAGDVGPATVTLQATNVHGMDVQSFTITVSPPPTTAAQYIAAARLKASQRDIAGADADLASALGLEPANTEANALRAMTRLVLILESQAQGGQEPFTDTNGNGRYDGGEPFTDTNSNLTFDAPRLRDLLDLGGQHPAARSLFFSEPFVDGSSTLGGANSFPAQGAYDSDGIFDKNENGRFDPVGEPYSDLNSNGVRDAGEKFEDTNGNGQWDAAEPFADRDDDGVRDAAEPFTDTNGNGAFDDAEPFFAGPPFFLDENGNGQFDQETFTDLDGDGVRDHRIRSAGLGLHERQRHDLDGRVRGHQLLATFPSPHLTGEWLGTTVLPELDAVIAHLTVANVPGFTTSLSATERGQEPYTDVDADGRFDEGEFFQDLNSNGVWDVGEFYVDEDGDGHHDAPEPFVDTNGDGNYDDLVGGLLAEVDQADVLLLRSFANGAAGLIRVLMAHHLPTNGSALFADSRALDLQGDLVGAGSNFTLRTVGGAALLSQARTYFTGAFDDFIAGSSAAAAEVDDQADDLFVIRDPDDTLVEQNEAAKRHENARTQAAALRDAMNGLTTYPDLAFVQQDAFTDLDSNGQWFPGEFFSDQNGNGVRDAGEPYFDANSNGSYDAPEPLTVDHNGNFFYDADDRNDAEDLNLSAFFGGSIADLRTLVPTYRSVTKNKDPGRTRHVMDGASLRAKDPTLGGLAPTRTVPEWLRIAGKGAQPGFFSGVFGGGSITIPPQDLLDPSPNGFRTVLVAGSGPGNAFFDGLKVVDGPGADIRITTTAGSVFTVRTSTGTVLATSNGTTTLDLDLATLRESFTDTNTNGVKDPGEPYTEDLDPNGVFDDGLPSFEDSIVIEVPAGTTVEIDSVEALH